MIENLEKLDKMLKEDPELEKKMAEEIKRVVDSGEAKDAWEAMFQGIRNSTGVVLTDEQVKFLVDKCKVDRAELSEEDLEKVSGGSVLLAIGITGVVLSVSALAGHIGFMVYWFNKD